MSPTCKHVGCVVPHRTSPQVLWVNARGVITGVEDKQALGYRTNPCLVGQAVCLTSKVPVRNTTVPVIVSCCINLPTTGIRNSPAVEPRDILGVGHTQRVAR